MPLTDELAEFQVPKFSALYVISDLHMGGEGKNKQIFNQGDRLAKFVSHLAKEETCSGELCLVINGDFVDFLAEKNPQYFDAEGAISRLSRIANDESFSMVFEALAAFVRAPHRHLAITLGNHDVELALPGVKAWLTNYLAGSDGAAQARLTLAFDGCGFPCRVGREYVLCVHGNEVDPWNVVDYRQLMFASRNMNRLQAVKEWDANAGTRLVIDVMNTIKAQFPFIDLLKPEIEAAVPILCTMLKDPLDFERIGRILKIAGKYRTRDAIRLEKDLLSGDLDHESYDEETSDADAVFDFLVNQPSDPTSKDELLDAVYNDVSSNRDVFDQDSGDEQYLGLKALWIGVKGRLGLQSEESRCEELRKQLQKRLAGDRSFQTNFEDETFKQLDEMAGNGVDFLVSGHTHLARALSRSRGFYYNGGTWVRLIELDQIVLDDPTRFAKQYEGFKTASLTELDKITFDRKVTSGRKGLKPDDADQLDLDDPDMDASIQRPLVRVRPLTVSITEDESGRATAELQRVKQDGTLRPVDNTRYPK